MVSTSSLPPIPVFSPSPSSSASASVAHDKVYKRRSKRSPQQPTMNVSELGNSSNDQPTMDFPEHPTMDVLELGNSCKEQPAMDVPEPPTMDVPELGNSCEEHTTMDVPELGNSCEEHPTMDVPELGRIKTEQTEIEELAIQPQISALSSELVSKVEDGTVEEIVPKSEKKEMDMDVIPVAELHTVSENSPVSELPSLPQNSVLEESVSKMEGRTMQELEPKLETSSQPSVAPFSAPPPSYEPDNTPVLRWKSYSGNQREQTRLCPQKPNGNPGKLVITLCGTPRSLMKLSPAPFKNRLATAQAAAAAPAVPVSSDKPPESSAKTVPVPQSPKTSLPPTPSQEKEVPKQPTEKQSIGEEAISELAKKVRLRVKRVRLPVKPNLLQKRDDAFDVKILEQKHMSTGELPVATVQSNASEEREISGNGPCESTGAAEVPGLSNSKGIGGSEGGGMPLYHKQIDSGDNPNMVSSSELRLDGICSTAEVSAIVNKQNVGSSTVVIHPLVMDPLSVGQIEHIDSISGSLAPAIEPTDGYRSDKDYPKSHTISMEGLSTDYLAKELKHDSSQSFVVRPQKIESERTCVDRVDDIDSSCRSMATSSSPLVGTDVCGSKKEFSKVQTNSLDDLSRENITMEHNDHSAQAPCVHPSVEKVYHNDISCRSIDGYGSSKGYSKVDICSMEDAARDNVTKEHKYSSTRARHFTREPSILRSSVPLSSAKEYSYMTGTDGALSETSMLEGKEQTLLETLLPDEPPGYSSAEASESNRSRGSQGSERAVAVSSQSEEFDRADAESSETESSESVDTESSNSEDSEEPDDTGEYCKRLSPITPGRGAYSTEQVPSVLCDAEGNVWHVGKRAEKARSAEKVRNNEDAENLSPSNPSNNVAGEKIVSAHDSHSDEVQDCAAKSNPSPESVPSSQQIQLNWRWPTDADYTSNALADVNNRFVVVKERSVFVGCIPDGIENIGEILETLMEKFLERFEIAPAILGQIQVVKVLKDFAFLELATEKVAQIVLAANQLDVFEWGVNGYHFNIEGCNGTHTSVRPLIEYMPLKPTKVVFIGNIPQAYWEKDHLEAFFCRILQGSDAQIDIKLVTSVYLLPESCDAYLEFSSELIADALMYKCTKNPQLLKELGEETFICRDVSSTPLMSRHRSVVSPQRSLFVGVTAKGEDFKIDAVRKIFDDILLLVSRKGIHRGYIEYISVQPGKDYAFFQFNCEEIVDSIMDEYIENTQLFTCKGTPVPYIILRPPEYVRPGARYYSDNYGRGASGHPVSGHNYGQMNGMQGKQVGRVDSNRERNPHLINQGLSRSRSTCSDPPVGLSQISRVFGEEPGKKPDSVMSIGVSPLPIASWNGLSSAGESSADPECMVVVEGLANKGLSYKLLRGALNELFERTLCQTGLLEVGMLVMRYLDRDANFNLVACLPDAEFVYALLSLRKVFIVAGHEVRLLPKYPRRTFRRRMNPVDMPGGQGDLSCLSDEDAVPGRRPFRNGAGHEWNNRSFFRGKKRLHIETEKRFRPGYGAGGRGPVPRKDLDLCTTEWCQSEGVRSFKPHFNDSPQQRNGVKDQHRGWNGPLRNDNNLFPLATDEESQWQGSNLGGKMPRAFKGAGFENRSLMQVEGSGRKFKQKRVPKMGMRKILNAGAPQFMSDGGMSTGKGIRVNNRKRMRMEIVQDGPMRKVGMFQERFRKQQRFEGIVSPRFP